MRTIGGDLLGLASAAYGREAAAVARSRRRTRQAAHGLESFPARRS